MLTGRTPWELTCSVKVSSGAPPEGELTWKTLTVLLPALTTKSQWSSGDSATEPESARLTPVPVPCVAKSPAGIREPSGPIAYARTALPVGLFVIVKTAPRTGIHASTPAPETGCAAAPLDTTNNSAAAIGRTQSILVGAIGVRHRSVLGKETTESSPNLTTIRPNSGPNSPLGHR
jgi:hypothetical protein